jgi:ABC-2 type transport system ATP-binding protein/ribosome-dependent ATPase
VILAGRAVRVPDADSDELDRILKAAGITAIVEPVAATIEERMLVLARDTRVA